MTNKNSELKLLESKKYFLRPEDIQSQIVNDQVYALENEWPRIKKNKNSFMIWTVGIFIFAFVIGSMIGTYLIEEQNKNLVMNISDFSEIDGAENLKKAMAIQEKIDAIETKIRDRENLMRRKLRALKDERNLALEMVWVEELSKEAHEEKIKETHDEFDKRTAAMKRAMRRRVNALKEQKKELELEFATQTKNVENLQQLSIIENQKRLEKLRQKQIEAKYDQRMDDLEDSFKDDFNRLKGNYNELLAKMKIKYNAQLEDYKNGMNYYMSKNGHAGLVLSVDEKGDGQVYIHPLYDIKGVGSAMVFGKDNVLKAEVRLEKQYGYYKAKVKKQVLKKAGLNPLDSILLELDKADDLLEFDIADEPRAAEILEEEKKLESQE